MINFPKIRQSITRANRRIFVSLVVLALIIIGLILLAVRVAKPTLGKAVFYYKGEGKDSKLFYMKSGAKPQYLITLPSEESELSKYKVPRHSYVSNHGNILVYFEKTGQIPVETLSDNKDFTAFRIIYKPKYIDLKNSSINDIDQDLDAGSLVFSPDDKKIAWVLSAKESTIQELESAGRKREVWLSSPDGDNARRLATLDDKVVLLQKWHGDYIYFWAVKGVGYYGLGKINVKTGQVKYTQPKYCSENLSNCRNFSLSSSGEIFIYEAGSIRDGKEVTELFVGDFSGKKSWQILVKNYISDRLWMPDGENLIYTEQQTIQEPGPVFVLREKLHKVNLKSGLDKEIYTGSYLSQLTFDGSGKYLYFIEKETDEKFNLVRLNLDDKKTEILDFGQYNQLQIFSGN